MKFVPLPDPRKGVTKEQLADLRSMGVLPGSVGAFANVAHFAEVGGIGMPAEVAGAKYWRDNATIWNPDREQYRYTMLDRDSANRTISLPLDFSGPMWGILSPSAANFYRTYAAHFPAIPALVVMEMSRSYAGGLNFESKSLPMDYPLGVDGRFPANLAIRFNPQTGDPEVFNFEEYTRTFPIDWTPKLPGVPGTGGRLSAGELVGAVAGVIASDMDDNAKAAAIRSLANR